MLFNGALAAAGASSAPASAGKKNHCPRTALIAEDAATGTTARADTNTPRLPSCAAWPAASRPGWSVYTTASCSETDTDKETGGKKRKENQVSIPHSWPQRATAGLFHGYLTHGRGSRANPVALNKPFVFEAQRLQQRTSAFCRDAAGNHQEKRGQPEGRAPGSLAFPARLCLLCQ